MNIEEHDLAKHDAIVDYFETKDSELSSDVLTLNRRVLGYFFVDTFPETEPSEITTEHVREFLNRLDERALKLSSKRRYLEVLSAFFDYALRDEDIEAISFNPPGIVLETYPRKPKSGQ